MKTAKCWFCSLTVLLVCLVATPATAFDDQGNLCGICTPSPTSSNGAILHPEIVLIFWGTAWNGSQSPSFSQLYGDALYIVNSPYYSVLAEYKGSYGQLNWPRLSPMASIYTSNIGNDSPNNFKQQDIVSVITNEISAGAVPKPQPNGDTVYLVFTPNGTAPSDCSNCTGFNAKTDVNYNGTSFFVAWAQPSSVFFSHESVEAIEYMWNVFAGNNCTGQSAQLADVCDCYNPGGVQMGQVNVTPVWSAQHGACVFPDSWGGLGYNTGSGWSSPSQDPFIRQAYGANGGVIILGDDDNAYWWSISTGWKPESCGRFGCFPGAWGGAGAEFAGGGGILAGLTMDVSYGVNYYTQSSGAWTYTGGLNGATTSVAVLPQENGVVVATDHWGQIWYWNPGYSGWHHIPGGPTNFWDQIIAGGDSILAIPPDHSKAWYYPGTGMSPSGPTAGWSPLNSMETDEIIASPDAPTWFGTFSGTDAAYMLPEGYIPSGWNPYYPQWDAAVSGLTNNAVSVVTNLYSHEVFVQSTNTASSWNNWSGTNTVGRLISGADVFGTDCTTTYPNSGQWPCTNLCLPAYFSCHVSGDCCSFNCVSNVCQ